MNTKSLIYLASLLLLRHVIVIESWQTEEMDMFDLVEDIKISFYEFLRIEPTATTSEIKKAYRRLSLEYHPDRNPNNPNSEKQFRDLSSIYQILKDKELRKQYDDVLENGLPDWKMPLFYVRKVRKMSNVELVILFITILIGIHYAAVCGSVYEKRWTMRDRLEIRLKRNKASDKRKVGIDVEINELLKEYSFPTFWDILPFALVKGFYNLTIASYVYLKTLILRNIHKFKQSKEERMEMINLEEERLQLKLNKQKQIEKRKQERKAEFQNMDPCIFKSDDLILSGNELRQRDDSKEIFKEWSCDDEQLLIRLSNKYPGGFPNRWQKISEILERSLSDVTAKAYIISREIPNRMQSNHDTFEEDEQSTDLEDDKEDEYYLSKRKAKRIGKLPTSDEKQLDTVNNAETTFAQSNKDFENAGEKEEEEDTVVEIGHVSRKKHKNLKAATNTRLVVKNTSSSWTQQEQNQLENAIKTISKGHPERWLRIAECIPTKSATEVSARIKLLSDASKQKAKSE